MKRSNAHEVTVRGSSGDVVHVFMSSFSETGRTLKSRELQYVCVQ